MPSVHPARSFTDYFGVDTEPPAPKPEPRPVAQYRFRIDCPNCGGTLNHEGRSHGGLDAKAVVHCPPCHRRWTVDLRLRPCTVGK